MKKILLSVIVAFLMGNVMYAQKDVKEVPEDVQISKESILYWVGQGEHEIIFAVNWCDPEIAFAWGYRFSEDSILVSDIMTNLASIDPRFSYELGEWGIGDILFKDATHDLKLSGDWWMYNLNGSMAQLGYDAQYVQNNDFIKWGDAGECAHTNEDWSYFSWTTEITPIGIPEDVQFSKEEILYWVGEGSNEVVFTVNWCDPEIAFAWGYRFSEDSLTLSFLMDDIALEDSRFSYNPAEFDIVDINYNDDSLSLALTGEHWIYNINGTTKFTKFKTQYVKNGDFVKLGDDACAHIDINNNHSWTTEITPVSDPDGVGIAQYNTSSFNVYPNPAHNEVNISCKELSGNMSLYLFDISGKVIYTESFYASESMVKSINVGSFAKGLYFIRLQNGTENLTQKLIIQ